MKLTDLKASIERQKKQAELDAQLKERELQLIKEKKRLERETKQALKKKAREAKKLTKLELEERSKLIVEGKIVEEEPILVPKKKEIRYILTIETPPQQQKAIISVYDKWSQRNVCTSTTLKPDSLLPKLVRYYGKYITKIVEA